MEASLKGQETAPLSSSTFHESSCNYIPTQGILRAKEEGREEREALIFPPPFLSLPYFVLLFTSELIFLRASSSSDDFCSPSHYNLCSVAVCIPLPG